MVVDSMVVIQSFHDFFFLLMGEELLLLISAGWQVSWTAAWYALGAARSGRHHWWNYHVVLGVVAVPLVLVLMLVVLVQVLRVVVAAS